MRTYFFVVFVFHGCGRHQDGQTDSQRDAT